VNLTFRLNTASILNRDGQEIIQDPVAMNISICEAEIALQQNVYNAVITRPPDSVDNEGKSVYDTNILSEDCSTCKPKWSSNNGVYSSFPCGVSLKSVDMPPGNYIIIPSTFNPMVCKYELSIFAPLVSGPNVFLTRVR
jgi:hypothetical protein